MSVEDPPTAPEAAALTASTPATTSDLTTKLTQLKASATQQYSLKNYAAAAEFFSEAAEIQDQLNGEMSLDNADLLYQYGRCLYHVAVAKSDVLGGKVASSEEPKRKKRKVSQAASGGANGEGSSGGVISDALKHSEEKLAEDVVEAVVEEKEAAVKKEEDSKSKPYFQITGDENFTDSEDEAASNDGNGEEAEAAADAEAEEEEDDFATAFEILDVARVLLGRKLEASSSSDSTDAATTAQQRQLKERLADTHDLQAEISLENERFHDAIKDTRDALALKLELYPLESSLVAEAHFKLSLALEFASVTSTSEGESEGDSATEGKVAQVDEKMRAEAAAEMEKAIASCQLRISKETALLSTLQASANPSDKAKATDQQKSIADVQEMVTDMQARLLDLRNPAVSLSAPTGPAGAPGGDDAVRGILGDLLGESKAEQAKRIEEATKGAKEISGLVRRKKVKVEDGANGDGVVQGVESGVAEGKGKRKLASVEDGDEKDDGAAPAASGGGKKVKFLDGA